MAGLLEGCRGSVSSMYPTVTPTVHIVNPTPTTAATPGSATSIAPGLKRSGHSSHANRAGVSRLGPSPQSMILPSGVTHMHQILHRKLPILRLLQMLQAPLSLLLLALLCRARVVRETLLELPLGGRPIGPSLHVVPSQNTHGHSGSASVGEPAATFAASVRQLGSRRTSACPFSFS